MQNYNVLNEPWIPVQTTEGEKKNMGIQNVLEYAHEIKEVVCGSPLETYAVQRFLVAFLMDAYHLKNVDDRKRLFQHGKFDANVLCEYINLCRKEGVSFDLFDTQRPFYQASYNAEFDTEKKVKSAAYLFPHIPSGDSHVHFDHKLASERSFSPADCMRGLLACQLFAVHTTGDYPSSVNDTPCYYVLIQGKTLFETLTLNMLSVSECYGIKFDSAPVAWRDTSIQVPYNLYKKNHDKQDPQHPRISMLEGLTWQPRRITLVQDEDQMIRNIYYQPGQSFNQNGEWQDPHVTYKITKAGYQSPITPELERAPWRDIAAYALSKDNMYSIPATIIRQAQEIISIDGPLTLMLYGLATSNAKMLSWVSDSLKVPSTVLLDFEKAERLRIDVEFVECIASLIESAVKAIAMAQKPRLKNQGKKKQKRVPPRIIAEAKLQFFTIMHDFLFSNYMHALINADCSTDKWDDIPITEINKKSSKEALRIVNEYALRCGNTAKCLEVQAEEIQKFKAKLSKKIKERT